jgi:hypothetical protein
MKDRKRSDATASLQNKLPMTERFQREAESAGGRGW